MYFTILELFILSKLVIQFEKSYLLTKKYLTQYLYYFIVIKIY